MSVRAKQTFVSSWTNGESWTHLDTSVKQMLPTCRTFIRTEWNDVEGWVKFLSILSRVKFAPVDRICSHISLFHPALHLTPSLRVPDTFWSWFILIRIAKYHEPGGLWITEIHLSQFWRWDVCVCLEPTDAVSGEDRSPLHSRMSSLGPYLVQASRPHKSTNSIHLASTHITSSFPRPCFLKPSFWGPGFNIWLLKTLCFQNSVLLKNYFPLRMGKRFPHQDVSKTPKKWLSGPGWDTP